MKSLAGCIKQDAYKGENCMRIVRNMNMKQLAVTFLVALTTGIVVFGLPSESRAQNVNISGVTVKVGSSATFAIWTDQSIAAGETLVLAQNAAAASQPAPPYNFDISDTTCPGGTPGHSNCPAAVVSFNANGTAMSLTDTTQALTVKNADPSCCGGGNFTFNEAQKYTQIGSFQSSGLTITVSVGYADNAHNDACGSDATSVGLPGSNTCFPEIFDGVFGGTKATFFQGKPQFLPSPWTGSPHAPCTNPNGANPECWDSGVILFSAVANPPVNLITVTQGGWGSAPHGNNPGAFLVANFSKLPPPVVIGCTSVGGKTLTFTTASAIQGFLPQGGTPGTLSASATNPNSSDAGVFAGQVLALQLNVSFSNKGLLGSGLGTFVLPSGPAAGKTVNQVLADANKALGGCGLPSYVSSISELNDIVTGINEMFD
jgi:hypothetical protein